ncbi:hypothetical protein PBRA_008554 [Plasmodiophora brassicae]|nr:hypothetical protein PBRA_008554 [Plasmodiophora brassicae]
MTTTLLALIATCGPALVVLGSSAVPVSSQDATDPVIVLESGRIDTLAVPQFDGAPHPSSAFAQMTFAQRLLSSTPSTLLVQVEHASSAVSARLQAQHPGITVVSYLPNNAFLVYGTHASAWHLRRLSPDVLWVGHLPTAMKISLSLTKFASPVTDSASFFGVAPLGDPLRQLVVQTTCDATPDIVNRVRRALAAATDSSSSSTAVSVVALRPNRLLVHVRAGDLLSAAKIIADDPAVHWVERRLRHQFLNRWARGIMANGLNVTANYQGHRDIVTWDNGLDGQGQMVGLGDSGIDKRSCFFASRSCALDALQHASQGTHLFPVNVVDDSDKIAMYVPFADSSDASGHGTHVAGIMAGDPHLPDGHKGTLPTFAGMAPQARIAFVDVGDDQGVVRLPDDLQSGYLAPLYDAGARVIMNGWGAQVPLYTHEAHDMDAFMFDNADAVIVNPAGNAGACNEEGTIATPGTSKNGVTVGASLSNQMGYRKTDLVPEGFQSHGDPHLTEASIAAFSGKGPTQDGRIKPDLVAPGYFVYSANTGAGHNGCDGQLGDIVTPNAGTSMAAGVMAGTLALVRQYVTDGFYSGAGHRRPRHGFTPSGALLKALAISGAVPLNGTRQVSDNGIMDPARCPAVHFTGVLGAAGLPNIDQGWGRTQLDRVLAFSGDDVDYSLHIIGRNNRSERTFGDPEIGDGQEHLYRFCALETHTEVKVTLVWTDAPATLGAGLQLVNDLDLRVQIDKTVYWGNDVDRGDRRNPVEHISVETRRPLTDVVVGVEGRRISVGDAQAYALVVNGRPILHGPCRPHHEMHVIFKDDNMDVDGHAFRLLNTARKMRIRVPKASAFGARPARRLPLLLLCAAAALLT